MARSLLLKRPNPLAYPGGTPGFDPSHPMSNGLAMSAVSTGGNFVSLQTGKPGTIGGSPSAFIGTVGKGTKFTTNANVTFPAPTVLPTVFTVAAIFELDGVTGNPTQQLINNVAGGGMGLALDGAGHLSFGGAGGAVFTFPPTSGASLPFGIPFFFVASFAPSAASATGVLVNLLTGQTFSATSSLSGGMQASDGNYYIGNRGLNSRQLDGGVHTVAWSYTYLSLPQLLQWAQDPWSFWYPQKLDLGLIFGGASSASVSAALSGSACAALAGSFADAMAITIAGASISCVAGVLNDNVAPAFPGAAASISAGTLKDAVTVALAGAGSSISAGAFATAVAKALTGAGASSAAGVFLEVLTVALIGAAASSAAGVFSDAILDALSGAVASCAAGTLSASSSSGGTVSLTGASATIAAGLFADAIARALTGASSSASAGVLSPGNALNLAIAGASANALAGSLSVTEVGAVAGGSANAAAGNLAELASIALSGAGVTAGAGIIGNAVTVAPSGAQIAALAGFIVATRPGQVGLFGAFARASAGILVVSAISGSTGIFAFLDVHGAMSSEEFNELAARTG